MNRLFPEFTTVYQQPDHPDFRQFLTDQTCDEKSTFVCTSSSTPATDNSSNTTSPILQTILSHQESQKYISKIPGIDDIFYQHYQNILFNIMIAQKSISDRDQATISDHSSAISASRPTTSPSMSSSGRPQLKLPTVPAETFQTTLLKFLTSEFPQSISASDITPCSPIDSFTPPKPIRDKEHGVDHFTINTGMISVNADHSLRLRQRGRTKNQSPWGDRVRCRLCQNQIMTNRLANLQNHARRHSKLKQFHCPYCSYAHTEVAKVRLHIDHNHDSGNAIVKRDPLDLRDDKMEQSWGLMMRVCFPDYSD